ncbi:cob(I)yrinic acid a,c-diamide adenosyltransferase, partial [bacterium]|nr:cob(I)yrinic acid a,c-diamide adenosyltransferase [bacterium]
MKSQGYGKIHVYTGNGKGKTTAAFGLAFRACGRDKKVAIIQFLKGKGDYGETRSAELHKNLDVYQFGRKSFVFAKNIQEIDSVEVKKGIELAKKLLKKSEIDILILDEINIAIDFGLIDVKVVMELFTISDIIEIILTGRNAKKEIIEKADLVTE